MIQSLFITNSKAVLQALNTNIVKIRVKYVHCREVKNCIGI